jgi:glycosyltransferase involved in cell wall biosynthesis
VKVALVHNMTPGGARRTVAEQLPHFTFEVVEVCLEASAPVTSEPVVVPFGERAPGVPSVLRVPLRYADMVSLARAWRVAAERVIEADVDLVVAHPCQYLQAPPPLRLRLPSVYFCHEPRRVDYEPAAAKSRRAVTRGIYGALYRWQRSSDRTAVASASALTTNSRYTARAIAQAYGRSATTIPLGVPDSFRPAASSQRPSHILSVGSLIPSKGHDLAIESAALTRQRWPIVIVAPRDDAREKARLRGLADTLGVSLRIVIGISDAELCGLYQRAVATLYLAQREPLGLASLEAQACGSPVIVAAEGGLPETLVEGATGWAVRREASAVAQQVDRLEDSDARRVMSERAASHGATFTWKRSANAFEQVARQVIDGDSSFAETAA